jgi:hypothetical protein
MIGDDKCMSVPMNNPMEIMEDKEPREKVPGAPEWAWDPGVHVIIIPGWGIIGDYRRTFGIVVIFDHRGFSVLRSFGGWTFGVSFRYFSNDG